MARLARNTHVDLSRMTPATASVNPLLVELICRQLIGVTSPHQDACSVTCDPDDTSLWVRLVEPTATLHASAGLASYGLLVAVTGADTIHISGWSSRLLPGRRLRVKQWIARLATTRTRSTDRGADDVARTPFGVGNDAARAGGLAGLSPWVSPTRKYPPSAFPPSAFPPGESALVGVAPLNCPPQESNAADSASLLYAIDAAAEVYQRLLDERIECAEYMLTIYLEALKVRYADSPNADPARSVECATDDRQAAAFEVTSGARALA